jgi:uncharacterized protein (TIGR02246 family)
VASFDPDDPEILAAIDSVLQSTMAGATTADVDQVLAAAEGEGELTFITGEVMLSGIESIRARFEDTYAAIQSQHQDILEKRVRILSPDVALVLAIGEGTYTDKAGWTSDPVGIGTTLVFVRENGQWRIRHAHQSIVR